MPSPRLLLGRHSVPGAIYVVTTVVAGRRAVFAETSVASIVTGELVLAQQRGRMEPFAWVVMPDHLHWMFSLRETPLEHVVREFKSRSARHANAARGCSGALWQAGYYDHQLRNDEDLIAQARYILANPVRGGLAERPGTYPHAWCRYPL